MTKTEELNNLFDSWKREPGDSNFIRDGIVDEKSWEKAERKILFIMKEPNDDKKTDWDLREFCACGCMDEQGRGYTTTWGPTAQWVFGILKKDTSPWLAYEKSGLNFKKPRVREEFLKQVAIINLKKAGGGSSTQPGSLRERTKNHRELLQRQVRIIQPEIIVCCGTGYEIKKFVYQFEEWDSTSNGVQFIKNDQVGWILFDYYHPQARWPHNFLYTMLVDAVHEVLSK